MPYYDFQILSSEVKVIGVLKSYIMYIIKMRELSLLFFNPYALITNT